MNHDRPTTFVLPMPDDYVNQKGGIEPGINNPDATQFETPSMDEVPPHCSEVEALHILVSQLRILADAKYNNMVRGVVPPNQKHLGLQVYSYADEWIYPFEEFQIDIECNKKTYSITVRDLELRCYNCSPIQISLSNSRLHQANVAVVNTESNQTCEISVTSEYQSDSQTLSSSISALQDGEQILLNDEEVNAAFILLISTFNEAGKEALERRNVDANAGVERSKQVVREQVLNLTNF
jgi:hypothetical protein